MIVSLIILGALVVVGAVLYLQHRLSQRHDEGAEGPAPDSTEGDPQPECCGMHVTCERDSLLASVSSEIVYYDDEELDAFQGRSPQSYTPEETEMFRDVLLTLLPEDIAGWARSVQLRGIELPADVRDELLMIVAEARRSKA